MNKFDKFVPLNGQQEDKGNSAKINFVPNSLTMQKRQKERPENQVEASINEIQRFTIREP